MFNIAILHAWPKLVSIERLSDEGRRVKELEKKLKTTELELEILKKAIAVFSKIDK